MLCTMNRTAYEFMVIMYGKGLNQQDSCSLVWTAPELQNKIQITNNNTWTMPRKSSPEYFTGLGTVCTEI